MEEIKKGNRGEGKDLEIIRETKDKGSIDRETKREKKEMEKQRNGEKIN